MVIKRNPDGTLRKLIGSNVASYQGLGQPFKENEATTLFADIYSILKDPDNAKNVPIELMNAFLKMFSGSINDINIYGILPWNLEQANAGIYGERCIVLAFDGKVYQLQPTGDAKVDPTKDVNGGNWLPFITGTTVPAVGSLSANLGGIRTIGTAMDKLDLEQFVIQDGLHFYTINREEFNNRRYIPPVIDGDCDCKININSAKNTFVITITSDGGTIVNNVGVRFASVLTASPNKKTFGDTVNLMPDIDPEITEIKKIEQSVTVKTANIFRRWTSGGKAVERQIPSPRYLYVGDSTRITTVYYKLGTSVDLYVENGRYWGLRYVNTESQNGYTPEMIKKFGNVPIYCDRFFMTEPNEKRPEVIQGLHRWQADNDDRFLSYYRDGIWKSQSLY